jgi:hypothetical protein
MRSRALPFVFVVLLSASAQAQVIWQPTPAPLVTAENTTWFLRGDPVEWNGDLFYQDGVPRFFNAYEMVRSGVFRGVPLYSDTMLEPNSVVFVPLPGGRMQPYRRRPLPQNIGTLPAAENAGLNQASAAPTFAPAYELPSPAEPMVLRSVGTVGRSVPLVTVTPVVSTVQPPVGVNNIWVNFDGRSWYLAGKPVGYDASRLTQVGTYYGWSVYRLDNDPARIYIPSRPGILAAYKAR